MAILQFSDIHISQGSDLVKCECQKTGGKLKYVL